MEIKNKDSALAQVWAWVQRTFRDPYKKEIEEYLASSLNLADLENRMRILKHRGML